MQAKLNAYISFRDNAREAMQFYHSVFGGDLAMSTFQEYQVSQDPSEANKIMHATLNTDKGMTLMAADTPNGMPFSESSNISLSLSGDNEAELRGYFQRLSVGGMVTLPLDQSPWGDIFGMCVDRFGVNWMIDILAKRA